MFQAHKEKDFTLLTNLIFKDMGNTQKRIDLLDRQGRVLFSRGKLVGEEPEGKNLPELTKDGCPGGALQLKLSLTPRTAISFKALMFTSFVRSPRSIPFRA
jgi:hypothetical protein